MAWQAATDRAERTDRTGLDDVPRGPDERIVVGFDGSGPAWDALRWAADEAGRRRATLEVVSCLPGGELAAWVRSQVDEATRVARHRGSQIHVRTAVAPGTPGRVLVDRAQGASLLVLGRHDPSRLAVKAAAQQESLSAYCVSHAPCPVMVVESAARPEHPVEGADGERYRPGSR
jgi:nucleotide-binding universal stress UspA family protein